MSRAERAITKRARVSLFPLKQEEDAERTRKSDVLRKREGVATKTKESSCCIAGAGTGARAAAKAASVADGCSSARSEESSLVI